MNPPSLETRLSNAAILARNMRDELREAYSEAIRQEREFAVIVIYNALQDSQIIVTKLDGIASAAKMEVK